MLAATRCEAEDERPRRSSSSSSSWAAEKDRGAEATKCSGGKLSFEELVERELAKEEEQEKEKEEEEKAARLLVQQAAATL